MAGEWQVTSFDSAPLEIIDGDRGKNYPKQTEFSSSEHCLFLNAGNVTINGFNFSDCSFVTEKKDSLLRKGKLIRKDVILTTRGTVGNVAFFDDTVPFEHIRINSGMVILRPLPSKLHPRYLYLFVRSPDFHLQVLSLRTGSAQPQLPIRDINKIQIPIPPLNEQHAIAHILGTLDDKIELNRRMNETLEGMARAIFKSWFIDFDPVIDNALRAGNPVPESLQERAQVRRRMMAQSSGHSPRTVSSPHSGNRAGEASMDEIQRLFPDEFEDSELGPIPKGWSIKPIGDAVRCVGGSTPSTKEPLYWNGGTNPFLTPKDLSFLTSPVVLDTERRITDAGVETISSGKLPIGTVLLSSRAPIGYLAIAEVAVSVNQGMIAMTCDGDLPSQYVLLWAEANMEVIKRKAGGTTFAEINKRNFRPIPAIVPSKKVLLAYVGLVEPMHHRIVNNLRESATLASIRETLLPKLISGELRVPDPDSFTEDLV